MAGARAWLAGVALLCGVLAGACGGAERNDAPSATVAARTSSSTTATTAATSTTTTTSPAPTTVEDEVESAYLRSWDVYADALLRLDASRLEESYTGPALLTRQDEVARLAAARTPARVRVEHDYEIVVLNADDAFVLEDYVNHSVLLDGRTMQPLEPDPNHVVQREYVLRRGESGWRVAHINATA